MVMGQVQWGKAGVALLAAQPAPGQLSKLCFFCVRLLVSRVASQGLPESLWLMVPAPWLCPHSDLRS